MLAAGLVGEGNQAGSLVLARGGRNRQGVGGRPWGWLKKKTCTEHEALLAGRSEKWVWVAWAVD